MKKYLSIIAALILIAACSGSDDGDVGPGPGSGPTNPPTPSAPTSSKLVFPDNNLECNQGTDITDTESTVEFRWEASSNTDTYEVVVTDLISGVAVSASTSDTKTNIRIKRATPYSWFVTSKSSVGQARSDTWRFYNSGNGIVSYAPFPATIVSPQVGTVVTASDVSEVTLTWNGADVDNDLMAYYVYSGTSLDAISIEAYFGDPEVTSYNLPVIRGVRYYWQIISIDSKGNRSESSIASFDVNP